MHKAVTNFKITLWRNFEMFLDLLANFTLLAVMGLSLSSLSLSLSLVETTEIKKTPKQTLKPVVKASTFNNEIQKN